MPGLSGCLHHFHFGQQQQQQQPNRTNREKTSRRDTKVIYETNSFLLHPMELVPFIVWMRFTLCHKRMGQRWNGEVSARDFRSQLKWVYDAVSILYLTITPHSPHEHTWCLWLCRVVHSVHFAGYARRQTKTNDEGWRTADDRRENGICSTQKKCRQR